MQQLTFWFYSAGKCHVTRQVRYKMQYMTFGANPQRTKIMIRRVSNQIDLWASKKFHRWPANSQQCSKTGQTCGVIILATHHCRRRVPTKKGPFYFFLDWASGLSCTMVGWKEYMCTDILTKPVWESSIFNEKIHTWKYVVIINNR
jgi:hypothetical protein